MLVELQVVTGAVVPLTVTSPLPWVDPKFAPEIVTTDPAKPEVGDTLVIDGTGKTVKLTPLLATPEMETNTFPVVAPPGTATAMLVALQLVGVDVVPLKVTVLVPCDAPKFVPEIVTGVPGAPELGVTEVMLAAGTTVKETPLLATPETVTTTLPELDPFGTGTTIVVELQLVGLAEVPLKVTELAPCDAPKLLPVIVTTVLTGPEVGDRLVIPGVALTVKLTALLTKPVFVTSTFPVVAPLGTGTTILFALQLVGVPAVPLKVTVLEPCVEPKYNPLTVTLAPTPPEPGAIPEIYG